MRLFEKTLLDTGKSDTSENICIFLMYIDSLNT